MTYVGDYRTTERDQILESVLVGPITRGTHKFCFQVVLPMCSHKQANAPDLSLVPEDCVLGVTIVFITCYYRSQEFIRIGYYVSNTCDSHLESIQREIIADQPRVTHTPILWE